MNKIFSIISTSLFLLINVNSYVNASSVNQEEPKTTITNLKPSAIDSLLQFLNVDDINTVMTVIPKTRDIGRDQLLQRIPPAIDANFFIEQPALGCVPIKELNAWKDLKFNVRTQTSDSINTFRITMAAGNPNDNTKINDYVIQRNLRILPVEFMAGEGVYVYSSGNPKDFAAVVQWCDKN